MLIVSDVSSPLSLILCNFVIFVYLLTAIQHKDVCCSIWTFVYIFVNRLNGQPTIIWALKEGDNRVQCIDCHWGILAYFSFLFLKWIHHVRVFFSCKVDSHLLQGKWVVLGTFTIPHAWGGWINWHTGPINHLRLDSFLLCIKQFSWGKWINIIWLKFFVWPT